jgi:hypothetical protein
MRLKKILLLWNYCANLNQTLLKWSLDGPLSKLCLSAQSLSKMAAMTKNRNFFKWPKRLYFKPERAQIWTVLVMAAILDTGRHWRTQFWKGATQGSSQQRLVEIGSVVSEEKLFFNFIPIFSNLQPPWLKIEMSSNDQNCSILSQKVPSVELYKHND